jgi:hypothetical protein
MPVLVPRPCSSDNQVLVRDDWSAHPFQLLISPALADRTCLISLWRSNASRPSQTSTTLALSFLIVSANALTFSVGTPLISSREGPRMLLPPLPHDTRQIPIAELPSPCRSRSRTQRHTLYARWRRLECWEIQRASFGRLESWGNKARRARGRRLRRR